MNFHDLSIFLFPHFSFFRDYLLDSNTNSIWNKFVLQKIRIKNANPLETIVCNSLWIQANFSRWFSKQHLKLKECCKIWISIATTMLTNYSLLFNRFSRRHCFHKKMTCLIPCDIKRNKCWSKQLFLKFSVAHGSCDPNNCGDFSYNFKKKNQFVIVGKINPPRTHKSQ